MVDARGYSCPTPVVMVQKAVKDGNSPAKLEVAVDNQCSVENVTRFAQNAGYKVQVTGFEGDFKLILTK